MEVHDPFVGMMVGSRRVAVVRSLELGNFIKNSACDEVLSAEALLRDKLPKDLLERDVAIILAGAKKLRVTSFEVGQDFPAGIYTALSKKMAVTIAKGALFPERLVKSATEQREIKKANEAVAGAIAMVRDAVAAAKVVKGRLVERSGKCVDQEGCGCA
jgi:hypothetical protein